MNEVTVVLTSSTGWVSGNAPLTLILNPSGYNVDDGAVIKIEYEFGDGTLNTSVKRRLTVDSPEVSAYAFPSDPGDPRNVIVSHNYFPAASGNPQDYSLKVYVTRANTFSPTVYTVPISVYKIDAINGLAQGYFEDIHMIGSRCHGLNNEKLLVFETKNPRYVTFLTFNDNVTIPTQLTPPSAGPLSYEFEYFNGSDWVNADGEDLSIQQYQSRILRVRNTSDQAITFTIELVNDIVDGFTIDMDGNPYTIEIAPGADYQFDVDSQGPIFSIDDASVVTVTPDNDDLEPKSVNLTVYSSGDA